MTWIKICGITNLEDALTAVEAGADALGFVFYEKSPRKIYQETARKIVSRSAWNVEKVGVFVKQTEDHLAMVGRSGLDCGPVNGDNMESALADLIVRDTTAAQNHRCVFRAPPDAAWWAMKCGVLIEFKRLPLRLSTPGSSSEHRWYGTRVLIGKPAAER